MNTQELEALLEGGAETQRIDFKGPCMWIAESFAKDILALSNVRDGGYIIIGIDQISDGKFKRKGTTGEIQASYKIDVMRDQVAAYADPHVNFLVDYPEDQKRLKYIVIRVFQFEEIPVICRKDSKDTKKGIIYYRNKDRRIESAPISNAYDMRDIIELAVVKMMQRKKEIGFSAEDSVKRRLDAELGQL